MAMATTADIYSTAPIRAIGVSSSRAAAAPARAGRLPTPRRHDVPSPLTGVCRRQGRRDMWGGPCWSSGGPRSELSSSGLGVEGAPWSLLFDLRERETEWLDGNQARLVVAFAAQKLQVPEAEVEQKLSELAVLLPDLSSRVGKLTPPTVVSLIKDTKGVALNLVKLKTIFPNANVSAVVLARPELVLIAPDEVAREAAAVAQLLGVESIDSLVEQYPRILDAEAVREALDMLRTLMPHKDPRATLVATPHFMSRVERGQRRLGANPDPGDTYFP